MKPPPLERWTLDARCEPLVRVGIVLAEDAARLVRITLLAEPYRLVTDPPSAAAAPQRVLEVGLAPDGLRIRIDDGDPVGVRTCRLEPSDSAAAAPAGAVVHDVVAGRGFHWQKRIDQSLPGTLEFRAGSAGVIVINEVPLEHYLAGVITAEMSGACPVELLKAQCVVARSWLLALSEPKHEDQPFDRCNDDCCQRYQGLAALTPAARTAVTQTRGQVLLASETAPPRILDANYSKSCGGISELPRHVWGIDKPGLSAVVDAPPDDAIHRFFPITDANLPEYLAGDWLRSTRAFCSPNVVVPEAIGRYLGRVDEAGDYFRWTVRYAAGEIEQLLREKLPEARDLAHLRNLRVVARGVSGRAVRVALEWEDAAGKVAATTLDSEYRIRQVLHRRFLFSSAIVFHVKHICADRIESVTIRGAGWGHGAGMCQIGALGMALTGYDYQAICAHYYPAARLATAYA